MRTGGQLRKTVTRCSAAATQRRACGQAPTSERSAKGKREAPVKLWFKVSRSRLPSKSVTATCEKGRCGGERRGGGDEEACGCSDARARNCTCVVGCALSTSGTVEAAEGTKAAAAGVLEPRERPEPSQAVTRWTRNAFSSETHLRTRSWVSLELCSPLIAWHEQPPERRKAVQRKRSCDT
jgi:hypothetical protein